MPVSDLYSKKIFIKQCASAWYEAQGKKRPRSPSADNRDKGQHNKADESTYITADDLTVELIVKAF